MMGKFQTDADGGRSITRPGRCPRNKPSPDGAPGRSGSLPSATPDPGRLRLPLPEGTASDAKPMVRPAAQVHFFLRTEQERLTPSILVVDFVNFISSAFFE